jgi:hypothetical protein
MPAPARTSGGWPYLALTAATTISWLYAIHSIPVPAPTLTVLNTAILPSLLLAIAVVLGCLRGRDWRTAITMMAIPPSLGMLIVTALGETETPFRLPWPPYTVLLGIVAVALGMLCGAGLRALARVLSAARS